MAKDFYYNVNGTEFHDTVAFGKAWKEAKALGKEEHCPIYRTVVKGDNIRYEVFAKGGCFLDERDKDKFEIEIF